jgi:thioredoxin 2
MGSAQLNDSGVVVACPHCGQKNRIQYERLDKAVRCGQCKSDIPGIAAPLDVDSEEHFNSLIGLSSLPVLVDFWAPWCGPCKIVAPEFAKVAAASAGKLIVAKVNTEEQTSLARRYAIHAIPTMITFLHGKEVGRAAGARPAPAIQEFVSESLEHATV